MAKTLAILLLPALLGQALSLQCNSCQGEYNCIGENTTCEDPAASCTTSVRKAYVSFLEFQSIRKGCASQLYPPESISLKSHLLALSYQAHYCSEDGCNDETYFVSQPAPSNHMRCHSCATQGTWCSEAARDQISCSGEQDQCVDLDINGHLGQFSNMKLKGCASLPRCQDHLSFSAGSRTIHASCCDTPLCNSFTPDFHVQNQAANGLECFSCVDGDSSATGCSSKSVAKVQCTGIHTMCLEGIGRSRKGGKDMGLITFKGCASPAMCQSSLLALVQELDNTDVMCCQGNLCNSRIVDGVVTEAKVLADSPNSSEKVLCATPTPTPSGLSPDPDCIMEEEDDSTAVFYPASGVAPSPGSHADNETSSVGRSEENADRFTNVHPTEKEDIETLVNEVSTVSPPHENTANENLLSGASESSTVSSTDSDRATADSFSATNLGGNYASNSTDSSENHGNVVVLVPIVVSKKNATTTTTSSSSETTTTDKEVLATSDDAESDTEECEAEDEGLSTGELLATAEASNTEKPPVVSVHEGGPSVTATDRLGDDYHATTQRPAPGHSVMASDGAINEKMLTTDGESFTTQSTTLRPTETTLLVPYLHSSEKESTTVGDASGKPVGTPQPTKPRRPCRKPGSASRQGGNMVPSSRADNQVMKDRDATHEKLADNSRPGLNAEGKVNRDSGKVNVDHGKINLTNGALGLTGSLGLLSLTFLLAALLH